MDQRSLILLGSLLLTVLAASFYWYGESDSAEDTTANSKLRKFAPEAIVSKFKQTVFNEVGIRHYQMAARTVTHFSQQSAAEMALPVITFYKEKEDAEHPNDDKLADQTDWVAKAKTGVILNEGESLVLKGKVKVTKPLANETPLTFNTESLIIMPEEQIAKTEDEVTLKQAEHITKAKGLVIDIASGKVELVSQVRSTYVPSAL